MTLTQRRRIAASQPTFHAGDAVITPRGRGTVVHHFPAAKFREQETYTVRMPYQKTAVVFYAHEIRAYGARN